MFACLTFDGSLMSALLNRVFPTPTMAAHLVSNSHGPHDLQDHASRTSHSAGLDAIETLKAVQGIINTYLANGGTDGRSTIPTPEPSPVPRFMEDAQHDVGLKARGEEAVRKDAGPTDAGPVTESAVIKEIVGDDGPHLGINVAKTNITSQAPQATHGVTLNEQDSSKLRGNTASTVPSASDMESGKPAGASLANEDSSADTKKPPPPPAMPGLDQDRLHGLVDDITRNVSQLATDDSARIKAATAALELAAVVRPPGDTIMSWFANMSVISAVRLFLHWGAFDIIPAAKGESITYSELASKLNAEDGLISQSPPDPLPFSSIPTNCSPLLPARVASMLTASHILLHHPPIPSLSGPPSPSPSPSLSHTPTSLLLRAHQPMSAMFSLLYTNIAHVSTILPSYFDAHGRAEPRGPARIPTSVLAGHPDEDFFGLLKRDAPRLRDFGVAMRMTSRRVPVTGMYDMTAVLKECEDAKRETVWVDVGGGDGHTVGEFLERYPGLSAGRCVVQDLEEVVEAARGDARERGLEGVRWVGMDFMRDAPVEGEFYFGSFVFLSFLMRERGNS